MDLGVGVGNWGVMSLGHDRESESLFDWEQEEESESLFDCEEQEKELKIVINYKEKAFSPWDNHVIRKRESEVLDGYVKQLVVTRDLDATNKIKEMISGYSKLADDLEPLVLKRLVEVLVEILDENKKESTTGSAASILAFANFDTCGDDLKKRAIQALVKLMPHGRDAISIPVLRTLTRLAYLSTDYASLIIENDAIEGACAVNVELIFSSLKRIQNLAKFLVVVVCRVQLPDDKLSAVVSILNKLLEVRQYNLRCIVRACYTLSCIKVELWVNKENILNNIIDLIWHPNNMIAFSALRVAAKIVKSEKSREILTKTDKFLKYLAWSMISCKPKKFQKEVCHIISNMAAYGGISIKDLDKSGLMDVLFKLLKADDFDVRSGAALTISKVISCHRNELASMTRDVTVS